MIIIIIHAINITSICVEKFRHTFKLGDKRFLVIVQLDAQIPFNIIIYSSLHVSSMSCSSSGETDCIDKVYTQPAHDTATNTEWHLPEAVSIQSVSSDDEHDMLEKCREL